MSYTRSTLKAKRAFTLIELLVVVAILAILAAILFPVFASSKSVAKRATCLLHMKQIGVAFTLYLNDYDDIMPDRRDLKSSVPGGYRPWTGWPPSDPRAGWAEVLFYPYIKSAEIWVCPSVRGSLDRRAEVIQDSGRVPGSRTTYWLWRFDRITDPVPLDNFWGKSPEQAVEDLRTANNPQVGIPEGVADTELMVDPYFPRTIPTVPAEIRGKAVHPGGRNRLFLDTHAKYLLDRRT